MVFPSTWPDHDLGYCMTRKAFNKVLQSSGFKDLCQKLENNPIALFEIEDLQTASAFYHTDLDPSLPASSHVFKREESIPPLTGQECMSLEPYFLLVPNSTKNFVPLFVRKLPQEVPEVLDVHLDCDYDEEHKHTWCIRIPLYQLEKTMRHDLEGPGRYLNDEFLLSLLLRLAKHVPLPFVCDFCLSIIDGKNKCGDCRKARYCNLECQRGGWPKHKLVCCIVD